jgi:hypothetical protein
MREFNSLASSACMQCITTVAINSGTWSFRQTSSSPESFLHRIAPGDRPTRIDEKMLDSGGSDNLSIFTIELVYFIFDLPWPPGPKSKDPKMERDSDHDWSSVLFRAAVGSYFYNFWLHSEENGSNDIPLELRMRCHVHSADPSWFFSVCHVHYLLCIESHNLKYKDSIYIVP